MAPATLIPDASVISKWLLDESDSDKARALRDLFLRGEVRFVVPSLAYYEVANGLRFNRLVKADLVDEFLEDLHGYEMEEVGPSASLTLAAVETARSVGSTVYDATYLALAKAFDGTVVTADTKFDKVARSRHVAPLAKVHKEFVG